MNLKEKFDELKTTIKQDQESTKKLFNELGKIFTDAVNTYGANCTCVDKQYSVYTGEFSSLIIDSRIENNLYKLLEWHTNEENRTQTDWRGRNFLGDILENVCSPYGYTDLKDAHKKHQISGISLFPFSEDNPNGYGKQGVLEIYAITINKYEREKDIRLNYNNRTDGFLNNSIKLQNTLMEEVTIGIINHLLEDYKGNEAASKLLKSFAEEFNNIFERLEKAYQGWEKNTEKKS